jgi:hypothetical protein
MLSSESKKIAGCHKVDGTNALLSGCTPRHTGSRKLWEGLHAPLDRESVCKVVSAKTVHGLHSMYPVTLKGI